jgi:hypothetical protein
MVAGPFVVDNSSVVGLTARGIGASFIHETPPPGGRKLLNAARCGGRPRSPNQRECGRTRRDT